MATRRARNTNYRVEDEDDDEPDTVRIDSEEDAEEFAQAQVETRRSWSARACDYAVDTEEDDPKATPTRRATKGKALRSDLTARLTDWLADPVAQKGRKLSAKELEAEILATCNRNAGSPTLDEYYALERCMQERATTARSTEQRLKRQISTLTDAFAKQEAANKELVRLMQQMLGVGDHTRTRTIRIRRGERNSTDAIEAQLAQLLVYLATPPAKGDTNDGT